MKMAADLDRRPHESFVMFAYTGCQRIEFSQYFSSYEVLSSVGLTLYQEIHIVLIQCIISEKGQT